MYFTILMRKSLLQGVIEGCTCSSAGKYLRGYLWLGTDKSFSGSEEPNRKSRSNRCHHCLFVCLFFLTVSGHHLQDFFNQELTCLLISGYLPTLTLLPTLLCLKTNLDISPAKTFTLAFLSILANANSFFHGQEQ